MKRVLITGGSRGIGFAVAKMFSQNRDFDTVLLARDFSKTDLTDLRVKAINFDLTKLENISKLFIEVGEIDVLINAAGIMNSLALDKYPEDKKTALMTTNLEAPILLSQTFAPGMIKQGGGRIINVTSVAAFTGHPDIWYGISKAGLLNVTKSLAKIWAAQKIIVNAVSPGPTETDMLNVIPEERKTNLKGGTYLQRFAKPEEIAEVIYWLATDAPEYLSGACIDLTNGSYPR